eukprot:CAMPEP_0201118898 /NCGR_PEP_ID=MMETSP0850-20130426/3097_1 /ASSEMBLY_ACC=CAM_ASM_000622 /TAXON_ID=183588 /ORGANISM="Pseudo-nitzschia fraudulenta, Strain WWA7" /LENGTH=218 /DNA_ID=CAMNT_0047384389 /DNA_START=97 /DNA_END=753 /DNA_ORIENTATION=+
MTGSASAGLYFDPPIPFSQFESKCEGDLLYTGQVVSIKKLEYGSFCVADNIDTENGPVLAYSKVDIVQCDEDKIYENWGKCSDSECNSCESEYHAYTTWETVDPTNILGYCYDYTFSMDVVEKTMRKTVGTFDQVKQVNFKFDMDADISDVESYVKMMDDNSCIAYGRPSSQGASKDFEDTGFAFDLEDAQDVEVSGAGALAASAAAVMATATAMMLA